MKKNHSIHITMLKMCTQFLKHCRDCRSKNVYKIVCTKRFVSINYRIRPVRRVLVTIECGEGDLMYIGANV